ncbi:MAG: hypothetical protein WCI27_01315 [Candidatus Omnitrophota bacterium]
MFPEMLNQDIEDENRCVLADLKDIAEKFNEKLKGAAWNKKR